MKNKKSEIAMIVILTVISVLFIAPIIIVFMNSFKSKLYINSTPFALPNADSFVNGELWRGSDQDWFYTGIFYYFIYNCSICGPYCSADFDDSMVSGTCKKSFYKGTVLSVRFCNDRTVPDGYVYSC